MPIITVDGTNYKLKEAVGHMTYVRAAAYMQIVRMQMIKATHEGNEPDVIINAWENMAEAQVNCILLWLEDDLSFEQVGALPESHVKAIWSRVGELFRGESGINEKEAAESDEKAPLAPSSTS